MLTEVTAPYRPPNNDSNEEVSYTWELISLDYTLEKVDDEESEERIGRRRIRKNN
ncbi:MAG: hypothetical protein CM15mP71_6160 [Candidatus Poseidoniales archaeon]|nr:MAG: hypothetical protein CM15mP71_6160 [Candidatus Poseidoniales archaeon]